MNQYVPLPPVQIRQGGGSLRFDDDVFVDSGRQDVEMLEAAGLQSGWRLVDFGCGPGRIAIALIDAGWKGSYLGIEVKSRHVDWATREITSRFPDYRFIKVDAPNARYNPSGLSPRTLPVQSNSADMICAFSVFSHMLGVDTAAYLGEFRRALTPEGRVLATFFTADDVPDETENPYWLGDWTGRLHCVLYSTDYLARLITEAGLTITARIPPMEYRPQDALVFGPVRPSRNEKAHA